MKERGLKKSCYFANKRVKKGVVYRSKGNLYTVESEGVFYSCKIKGKMRLLGIQSTSPVAVGDQVFFEIDEKESDLMGIITEVLERKNYIVRKSVNLSKQIHIIASNIDQVFLIITLNNPTTLSGFIDRLLVTAEAYQIPAYLLFNKIDSYNKQELKELRELKSIYDNIGYQTFEISAKEGWNIDKIKVLMRNKVIMFSGHSGVGKSTLINSIAPGMNLKTGAISNQHHQGTHTTTFAEMFNLSEGIKIIDTPGIKGFGVVDMSEDEIGNYYPEFKRLKVSCKFNNCLHYKEPQCAILKAVKDGAIAKSRYNNYLQMLAKENNYRI